MPQKTNLNTSPYYDDFNDEKNYYRVLFKPGFPVQSRELTTLQSILQNQVESFGRHVFKEGSMVIPGSLSYDDQFYAVKLNSTHFGVDISLYINQLVGKNIRGQNSGVSATVRYVLSAQDSDEGYTTLYVKYIDGNNNFDFQPFSDGETLLLESPVIYGNTTIASGESFASTIDFESTAIGCAISISEGIYFIRGAFVRVAADTLILDQYTNSPSYRVGLLVSEDIVTAKNDESLYDNARGFSNYAAPGADRFRISTILTKKALNDYDDKNFIEIFRTINGSTKIIQDKNQYSEIKNYLAKRTYDESGDYSVIPFNIEIQNSLNDQISSNGLYLPEQLTDSGNTPNEDLMCIKVSPGRAYVKGFDIDKSQLTVIDSPKTRTTAEIPISSIPFEMGNLIKVNNVFGVPGIGVNNNYYVSLRDQRISSLSPTGASGNEIGKARIYYLTPPSSGYTNSASQWDLYLYDIQTYVDLNLNANITNTECPATSFIVGKSSGASGYTVSAPSSNKIVLSQVAGSFIEGEEIIINGSSDIIRSIKSLTNYNIDDIKSIYQNSAVIPGFSSIFLCDTVLERKLPNNFNITDSVTITSGGQVTCPGKLFSGIKVGSIIRYQKSSTSLETFNRVTAISADNSTLTVSEILSVPNVCDGTLPSSTQTATFSLGIPSIKNEQNSFLYARLANKNISNVNISNSTLVVTKQVTDKSTDGSGNVTVTLSDVGITSAFFQPFDEERYSIYYDDGSVEPLSADQFTLSEDSTSFTLKGLSPSESGLVINTTVKKVKIKNKNKLLQRSQKLLVNKTKNQVSTQYGLTKNNFYGLRIEDKEISLNIPEVTRLIAVYESLDQNSPILDKLTFTSSLNLNTNAILGETIKGESSSAIARIVNLSSTSEIEIVYLNENKFIVGENVEFNESNISGFLQQISLGQYVDRTSTYTLDIGEKEQFYDYSRIIRSGEEEPSRKLLIIFDSYVVPSDDKGDLYTVNSYNTSLENIPLINSNTRCSDVIDFRPRVSEFTSTSASPFAFESRDFETSGVNSSVVITPNESSELGYSYYLPRIDKLLLNKNGEFKLLNGTPELNPKEPSNIDGSMTLATIQIPAYVFNTEDIKISLEDNRRFTMRDIGQIEDRLENLERVTSLSLLELDTKTLQIQDSDGLSRFKSGFFVDDFKDLSSTDTENPDLNCSVIADRKELTSNIDQFSIKSQVAPSSNLNINSLDFSSNFSLLDSNVRKTGDFITLNYDEVEWTNLNQPLATRVENVNPFNIVELNGNITLSPATDTWIRTVVIDRGRTRRTWGGRNFTFTEQVLFSREPERFMRSRNVHFQATGIQPFTRHYPFLDGNSGIDIVPKLLEISMISGQFEVGETVDGFFGSERIITFRVASQNHKTGVYNSQTGSTNAKFFTSNPYNKSLSLSGYNSSSTVLNVDTLSLSDESDGRFSGYVRIGMSFVGRTTGAQATLQNNRLITDSNGTVFGCFFIRDPNSIPEPIIKFATGTKIFKISSSSLDLNSLPKGYIVSSAQAPYSSTGILETRENVRVVVRRPPPPPPPPPPARPARRDPLAQTFTVDNEGGFLSSIDLWFQQKDENQDLTVELRTVELGIPTNSLVQDYSRVTLSPDDIVVSETADENSYTRVTFPSPVYLEPDTEYAIVLLAPTSVNYYSWIARMGEKTIETTNLPDVESVIYSSQYTGGSLFKSQNGTIWTANQYEDLKFRCNKCSFTATEGTAYFFNPSLQETKLTPDFNVYNTIPDPITTFPRKLIVGITNTESLDSILQPGVKVGVGLTTFGLIENIGGEILSVDLTNPGSNYAPSTTYNNVKLYTETGYGTTVTANVTTNAQGNINSVTLVEKGSGYAVGDVLGITTADVTKGTGAKISVSSILGIDTLYLTDVYGETFSPDTNTELIYYNGSTPVSIAGTYVQSSKVVSPLYEGNVIQIYDYSHGMHSANNMVTLSGVKPTTIGVKIVDDITISSTAITVENVGVFTSFEGRPVGTSNTGYALIDNEIIGYTNANVSTNQLENISRNVDDTPLSTYSNGTLIYKYELNGISLRRINTTHDMSSNSNFVNDLKTIDTYHLEINREGRSSGYDQVSFNDKRTIGGSNCIFSQNIQFSSINPFFNILTPNLTRVSAEIRTISATSSSGNEISFIDQGFEPVQLNSDNNLSTPRMIASRVNELNRLSGLPRNKSLTLGIKLSNSGNSNISPMIDTRNSAIFQLRRNRINKPIDNYSLDPRSNSNSNDPHASVYISKKINLRQPSTSLKVLVSAYRDSSADFRVYYKLFKSDSSEITQSYIPFPGYDNLIDSNGDGFGDTVIDQSKNSGRPDSIVRSSNDGEFLDYQFTADNLDQFSGFVIKIIMSGTNEAKPPSFKDLRVIALA